MKLSPKTAHLAKIFSAGVSLTYLLSKIWDFDDEEKVLVTPQKSKPRPKKKIKSEPKEPSTPWWRRIFKKKKKPKSNVLNFLHIFCKPFFLPGFF